MSPRPAYDVLPATPIDRLAAARTGADKAPASSVSPGEAISPALRQDFESQLGADFSSVRIHTDEKAGASALALGARAYSVGPDIVFAPGHYAPNTSAGRELIAHELYHVKQDGGRRPNAGESVVVGSPDSPQEHEAAAVAQSVVFSTDAVAASPLAHQVPAAPRHGGPVLHRSLLGAGIGGLLGGTIGAVGLGLLGGLLGPAGAVAGAIIGGIGGLVAGAIVGDIASRRSRSLTSAEKAYLREIFHDAVDYDKVTITRGSALSAGAARTTGNTINLQDEHFVGDTMDLSDAGQLTFAHEMGHVWQYQNGGLAYIPSSLIPQIVAGLSGQSRNAAYDWRNAVRNHIDWSEWNAEQQAECISDYNEALRRINAGNATLEDYDTVTLAQPFIELVRERIGAPGSQRKHRESPASAAAGATP
jgi:uncharacterized protein DUF4157